MAILLIGRAVRETCIAECIMADIEQASISVQLSLKYIIWPISGMLQK